MNSHQYERMLSEHPELLPAVPAPPGRMAWSGSNNLGNVIDFAPDANGRQTILKLDEWGPPEMWTLTLGIDHPGDWSDYNNPPGSNLYNFEAIAIIEFGSGGATQTVEVDWIAGTEISLPMNAVSVICEYDEIFDTLTMLPPPGLRLSAMIGRGVGRSKFAPIRTLKIPDLNTLGDAPASYITELPPFTREIEIAWRAGQDPRVASSGISIGQGGPTTMPMVIRGMSSAAMTDGAKLGVMAGTRNVQVNDTAAVPNRTLDFRLACHIGL